MFSKLSIIFTTAVALASFVAAGGPIRSGSGSSGSMDNSCNTGTVQCCNSIHKSDSKEVESMRKTLGINIPVDGFVGMNCSPLSGLGVGGGEKCQQQPVCCQNNTYKGIIVVGCSPININV